MTGTVSAQARPRESDTVQYVRDGSKLLQEIHSDYTITFLYDGDTSVGFNYGGNNYYYGADSLGVITMSTMNPVR